MLVVHVEIKVKEECIEAFKQDTLLNAKESRKEEGVARFDVLQRKDDPSIFLLEEAYHSREAQMKHRETKHFQAWREATKDMRIEPFTVVEYDGA